MIKFRATYVPVFVALLFSSSPTRGRVQDAGPVRCEESRISMACAYTIVAFGRDGAELRRVARLALDEVDRIDRLMSHYKTASPLSAINREAALGPVAPAAELFDFIADCVRYSRESDGAFDITVGPLMKAWGFFRGEGRRPTAGELSEVRGRIGYRHLILDPEAKTIRFDRDGVELDLGGIAKGYAVDRAVGVLKEHGIRSALVSAGGSTIYGLGSPPDSPAWEIKIQDPVEHGRTALKVQLNDSAVSVSGNYEKFFEIGGVRYSHIMDPRTGWPAQEVLSVVVLAPTGTAGDALDNAFFVLGIDRTRAYLRRLPGPEAIFFLPQAGKRWRSVRLKSPLPRDR
ncbi:MAG TPA: FAD:protein FMN transferase [Blastocatellia bacterium]|nr:FAD:protein FMN transferase [Blastocatellia bacterium]